ncbi:MAG: bifunctional precorrin-2 dehydrogenase/sirohydrochlorin ferrochelatase [Candidatus Omnitrophota bacterium]|jgi:precorrin-2 dehydrogenase/sirohydrochlorin ferrochelatase|nr:MAG: bifunctional precorrin-2 dehydrogenase/sirohydrochlorin ferrochelatase [Candidatus Omnitrophota bacterium]
MNDSISGKKPYYTICVNIHNKPCVVVGGGEVARRKVASLNDAGGRVTVISPKLESVLEYMAFQKEIQWKKEEFQLSDLDGAYLVVAATDNRDVNHQIGEICRKREILCNVVDAPEEGSFIVPSSIERGLLTIAISTSGISPSLASSIRQELEMAYGEEYGMFLELASLLRSKVIEMFPTQQKRQLIFDRMVSSRALSLLRNGMVEEAHKELDEIIIEASRSVIEMHEDSLPIINHAK